MSVLKTRRALHLVIYLIVSAASICSTGRAFPQTTPDIRRVLDGKMLPGEEVTTFERSDLLYPVDVAKRGGGIRPLAAAGQMLET
jgi:hypothetical protein